MCGIFGWVKPKANMTTDLDLAKLFREGLVKTQERGEDATGFYAPSIGIVKEATTAEEFVDDSIPNSIADERLVIGHCRWASAKYTKENVEDQKNAQPFESSSFVLVHNGTISTPRIKGYKFTSDIDSESIIAYAQQTGVRNALANIDGDSTVVLYDKKKKKMFFWTNGGKPLSICLYKDIIFFASTKKILQQTLKPQTQLLVFTPDVAYATIYEDELLEYDLQKNCFIRRGIVKNRVSKEAAAVTKSQIVHSHFEPVKSTLGIRKPLPRGCVANPPSQQMQLALPPPSSKDFNEDEQYGTAARMGVLETTKGLTRHVRINKDGSKIITYDYLRHDTKYNEKGIY